MINRLTGLVVEQKPPMLVLEVQGVGYELLVPMSTFYALSDKKGSITLLTQLIIREDAHTLYGFASLEEKTLFQTLIKINGVGPKLALAILSAMSVSQFVMCIRDHNLTQLVKVPGVGKKTAERLLIEIKDKLGQWENPLSANAPLVISEDIFGISTAEQDAISALISLGYKPQDAQKLIAQLPDKTQNSATLIRQALQAVG